MNIAVSSLTPEEVLRNDHGEENERIEMEQEAVVRTRWPRIYSSLGQVWPSGCL